MVGEAKKEWPRICNDLQKACILERTDRAIIIAYCNMWAAYKLLADRVALEGAIVMQNNNMRGSTVDWREMQKASKEIRILLHELGLTPAARGLPDKSQEEEKPELDF